MNQGLSALKGLKAPKKSKAPTNPPATPRVRTRPAKEAPPVQASTNGEPPDYSYEDRVAFSQAFAGVAPLGAKTKSKKLAKRAEPPVMDRKAALEAMYQAQEATEAEARRRLDQLVGGGVRFDVERQRDGSIAGKRRGAPDRTLRMLAAGELAPQAHLDLHGKRANEVAYEVNAFARRVHRAGHRTIALIIGKGLHSEGGHRVLDSAVVKALTSGGVAPLIEAFATAPRRLGGDGAILVRLRERLF